jgi:hypothetical protein
MNQSATADYGEVLGAVAQAGLFSATCSINAPPEITNDEGQVNLSAFTPVPSLQNLPCMIAPVMINTPPDYERKTQLQIDQQGVFHVLLDGYYPAILQKYQAVINGTAYDILTVESDSQQIMTRLRVREYSL